MTGSAASKLQPSNLRSNAYRSLPGDQDVFFQVFLSIGTLVSNSLPCSTTDGTKCTSFKYDWGIWKEAEPVCQ